MAENIRSLPHILLPAKYNSSTDYISPIGGGGRKLDLVSRDPKEHGQKLLSRLKDISKIIESKDFPGVASVKFIGEAGKDFLYEHLTNNTLGLELLSIKETKENNGIKIIANVQFSNKEAFENLQTSLNQYISNDLKMKTRKELIESTSDISTPDFEGFFTDHASFMPSDLEIIWWEIWLNGNIENVEKNFMDIIKKSGIYFNKKSFVLEDRILVLVKSDKENLSKFVKDNPYYIAEIRRTKNMTSRQSNILSMSIEDQHKLKDNILSKITFDDANTSIVILDSGINQGHPLIEPFLREQDNHSYREEWGTFDSSSHGTAMSSLALYGNLSDMPEDGQKMHIRSTLKGVKILPPRGRNEDEMYAVITEEAFDLTNKDGKNNVYVMAITNDDCKHNGRPTSWSAAIDKIAFYNGALFLISTGNFDEILNSENYWNNQKISCIEDPGQSWNAISVGAYTEIANADLLRQDGCYPFRNQGELSPYSRTSTEFDKQWPIKPEVLFEGGNKLVHSDNRVYHTEDLSLVSCEADFRQRLFSSFHATSAATALAGNFASELMAEYPNYWPETIRGLIIHSASWTDAMKNQFYNSKKTELGAGLKCFGYGVPNLIKAKLSGANSLTLISQQQFQLYKEGKPQMMEFDLPWPVQILEELGEKIVHMKITLSYFISPKAGNRGYEYKNKSIYRYQSFGLRFDLKRPLESEPDFRKRINKKTREKDQEYKTETTGLSWLYGPKNRDKGSIHSDILEVNGVNLAKMNKIIVYPTKGWWDREKNKNNKDMKVRFSLLVDIETDEVNIDLYNNIKNIIETPIKI